MASRLKEDEKNERIIRGLLKLPPNRKCINCNTLGPQYVCTTFSTFVCTTCAGIHREFTHRIKSISMAKFTPQEVGSLQEGGNERAREIYFKEWDPQRNSAPDSSNVDRLRDFIKHAYVDKRYASGERSTDRSPQIKMGDKTEPNESRRSDGYHSGSRSPSYDTTSERRYSSRSSPGYDVRRSPGYDLDNQRHSDYGRSPAHSGVVNDWRREDRFANSGKSEDHRSSDGESKTEIRSPDNQKDYNVSSSPTVRPVRDILGENVVPLRIAEPPKASSSRVVDGSTLTQRTASSSSLASANGNPTELKRETSLIDFDAEPEPAVAAAATQAPQSSASTSAIQPTSASSDDNWACFDSVPETKVSEAPPSSNSLESALTRLSVPTPPHAAGSVSSDAAPRPTRPSNGLFPSSMAGDFLFASPSASTGNPAQQVASIPSGVAAATGNLPPTLPANSGTGQWSGMQNQQLQFPHAAVSRAAPHLVSSFPSGLSGQGLTGNSVAQISQTVPNPASQMTEVQSGGRKELPADLFTAAYPSFPYQAPGWQARPVPGMGYAGYAMYHPTMPVQSMVTYPQPSKSANPFDVNADASPVQAAAFPSMSSLHAALPNVAASRGVAHPANTGGAVSSWMPPQLSSYPSTVPPHVSSFGSSMPGTYMSQQLPSNMAPSRPQGFGSFNSQGGAFGPLNPATPSQNPSLSGNPFG